MTVYSVEWISNWFSWEIKQEIALSSICHYFLSLELAALRPVLFKISRIFYASNHLICIIIEVSPKCIDPATCQYNHIWNNQVWSDSIQQISSVRPPCTSPHSHNMSSPPGQLYSNGAVSTACYWGYLLQWKSCFCWLSACRRASHIVQIVCLFSCLHTSSFSCFHFT